MSNALNLARIVHLALCLRCDRRGLDLGVEGDGALGKG